MTTQNTKIDGAYQITKQKCERSFPHSNEDASHTSNTEVTVFLQNASFCGHRIITIHQSFLEAFFLQGIYIVSTQN